MALRRRDGSQAGDARVAVDRSPPLSLGSEPAVAEPRTWFLRRGWRMHGLIDPNEIPGALEA